MDAEPLTADVTLFVIRDLTIWLSAVVIALCGAGVAVYGCLVWQVCAGWRQRRASRIFRMAALAACPGVLEGGTNEDNTLDP